MTLAKQILFSFVLLTSLIGAASSSAYPIYLKIENPRAHTLIISSETEGMWVEIPSGTSREFKIASKNDWRVRYTSGVLGKANGPNIDKELCHYIETSCKNCMGDNWDVKTVKYCTLRLDEDESGFVGSTYTMNVVEIRDLQIAYDADECKLSANEIAMKLIPISKSALLVSALVFNQAKCLFRSNHK